MNNKLDAIFFDIDDTLFSTTAFAEKARRASIRAMIRLGLKVEEEEGYRELMEVIREFSSNYGGHYEKFLSRMSDSALVGTSRSLLVAAAVVAYHETKFRELSTYEDVLEAMKVLSQTDLKLGIITSGLRIKQAEKIIRLRIWPYIDHQSVFITDEVGIGKPNPKLYRRACEVSGVEPIRCMYVGDHPLHDIDPANAIGMYSVWNHRQGRHLKSKGLTKPDYTIYNFLDLLGLLQEDFGFDFNMEI